MFKTINIKTEIKKIFREPIMILLFLAPLIIPIIFKLMLLYLVPFIQKYAYFDMEKYQHYLLSFTMLLNALLLSIVMGFTMIDDRDNKIVELMCITPMGKSGYIIMRLSLVFLFVIIYSLYAYFLMSIFIIPIYILFYIILLFCIYSAIMGLLLFSLASDKVNGLTYAKGLNVVSLSAFAPLLNIKWVSVLAGFFPPYWITQVIANPNDLFSIVMGAVTSVAWLVIMLAKTKF